MALDITLCGKWKVLLTIIPSSLFSNHIHNGMTYIIIFYTLVEILVCLKGLNVIELILQVLWAHFIIRYLPRHVTNIPFRKLKAKNYYSIPMGHINILQINPKKFFWLHLFKTTLLFWIWQKLSWKALTPLHLFKK